jgi:secondary thiamine-phosphate synthase enzyme
MIYTETIKLKIESQGISDITGKVEDIVRKSEIESGICTIFAVGATSAVLINENEPMLLEDLKDSLENIASEKKLYHHAENAFSHIRSMILGNSQTIPVKNSKLVIGNWQEIMIFNFDTDDREREVVITIVGE